MSISNIQNLSC